jgi:hypothetical protein
MRKAIVVAVSAVTAASALAASVATADSTRVASPAAPNCKLATIALTGPYTGTGLPDQLERRKGHSRCPERHEAYEAQGGRG